MTKEEIQKVKDFLRKRESNTSAQNLLNYIEELENNNYEQNKNIIENIIRTNINKLILDKIL
ncbi:hypothetical protein [Brachyspira innocens]|uniref:hypothetical protein n=1 Tax=Brachyspira innocens TaxID=13264 RepID=UPI000360B6B3|nr:hypothetical protein [Brachyspira innocens]